MLHYRLHHISYQEKAAEIAATQREMAIKDRNLSAKNAQIQQLQNDVDSRDGEIAIKDRDLAAKDRYLSIKIAQIHQLENDVTTRDDRISGMEAQLKV